jgi:hypothetical protein
MSGAIATLWRVARAARGTADAPLPSRGGPPTFAAMRSLMAAALLLAVPTPRSTSDRPPHHAYLFVWAGDSAYKSSDFMAVIDADTGSTTYGRVLTSAPVGAIGMPHHTEHQLWSNDHLLANDFHLGRTWLFDLNDPFHPSILTSFGDVAGFSHPHTFIRLANGALLVTFQYRADASTRVAGIEPGSMAGMHGSGHHVTGGLVEMDERGHKLLAASASDPAIRDKSIYPYSVLPIRAIDRAVSTTTDMDASDSAATSQWVQFWRLSDLKLLRSIALPPGQRGNENQFTGEPRLLRDGHSVYVHTFNCGLYLIRDVAGDRPRATFVHGFEGTDCGVPILTSHYWLQTVPDAHALVALDIRDPAHPREVSRVSLGANEHPHWVAIDPTGRRIVLNSAGHGSRLFIINLDPASGQLTLDGRFRDTGSERPGISMDGRSWPHGFKGDAVPHGSVFSR